MNDRQHGQDERRHFAKNLGKRRARQSAHDEQQQAVRRQRQADHHVEHDDNAEMHQIDAKALRDRHQQGHDDEQYRHLVKHDGEKQHQDVDAEQKFSSPTNSNATKVLRISCGTPSLATA